MDLVKEAISRTGYSEKIKIAVDIAATDFCIGEVFGIPVLKSGPTELSYFMPQKFEDVIRKIKLVIVQD